MRVIWVAEQPKQTACCCLTLSQCCGFILASRAGSSPAALPGRRYRCPRPMWELLIWLLKQPKSPASPSHGNPPVSWCGSSHSRLWLVSGLWKFSLYIDLIWKELFISPPYTHFLISFYCLFPVSDRIHLFSVLSFYIAVPYNIAPLCCPTPQQSILPQAVLTLSICWSALEKRNEMLKFSVNSLKCSMSLPGCYFLMGNITWKLSHRS